MCADACARAGVRSRRQRLHRPGRAEAHDGAARRAAQRRRRERDALARRRGRRRPHRLPGACLASVFSLRLQPQPQRVSCLRAIGLQNGAQMHCARIVSFDVCFLLPLSSPRLSALATPRRRDRNRHLTRLIYCDLLPFHLCH